MAIAVLVNVGRAGGHGLDLAGAKAGAGIVLPGRGIHASARRSVEFVTPDLSPGGGSRFRRAAQRHKAHGYHQTHDQQCNDTWDDETKRGPFVVRLRVAILVAW